MGKILEFFKIHFYNSMNTGAILAQISTQDPHSSCATATGHFFLHGDRKYYFGSVTAFVINSTLKNLMSNVLFIFPKFQKSLSRISLDI